MCAASSLLMGTTDQCVMSSFSSRPSTSGREGKHRIVHFVDRWPGRELLPVSGAVIPERMSTFSWHDSRHLLGHVGSRMRKPSRGIGRRRSTSPIRQFKMFQNSRGPEERLPLNRGQLYSEQRRIRDGASDAELELEIVLRQDQQAAQHLPLGWGRGRMPPVKRHIASAKGSEELRGFIGG